MTENTKQFRLKSKYIYRKITYSFNYMTLNYYELRTLKVRFSSNVSAIHNTKNKTKNYKNKKTKNVKCTIQNIKPTVQWCTKKKLRDRPFIIYYA